MKGTFRYWGGWCAPQDSERAMTPAAKQVAEFDAKDTIKPGDTVRLKSGGQSMTVEDLTGTTAFCRWMVAGTLDSANINVVALRKENVD